MRLRIVKEGQWYQLERLYFGIVWRYVYCISLSLEDMEQKAKEYREAQVRTVIKEV